MLDRYVDRPDESFCNERYGVLNNFCYAKFLRLCYIVPSVNENGWQPMELKGELLEVNSPATYYRIVISLTSSKENELQKTAFSFTILYFKLKSRL